jgi:hypothetical protein
MTYTTMVKSIDQSYISAPCRNDKKHIMDYLFDPESLTRNHLLMVVRNPDMLLVRSSWQA